MRHHLLALTCLLITCTSLAQAKTLIFEITPGGLLKNTKSQPSLYFKTDKQPGLLGTWTAPGLATMDYPSSFMRCQTLTFYADCRFRFQNIEKHLIGRDPVQYQSSVKGEFRGEWVKEDDNRIVVKVEKGPSFTPSSR